MTRQHTILVVDDEPDVVKSVKALLRVDYRVLGTTRAADAAQIMETEEVHVVMTDQRMPETTGVEFLHQVRGRYPDAIRLLFTGYADIRAVIDAINQGNVYRYITKPWDPDELQTVIREACERYDLIVERKELLTQLQRKNVELEESNKLKSMFIQVASHELRTPLSILLGLTALMQALPDDEPRRKDFLNRVHATSERLGSLVAQITRMLQVGQFGRVLTPSPVDLPALLRDAAEDVRLFVDKRHQHLDLEIPPDLGPCAIDAWKIRDSVNHLLLNAIKFTPDGGRIRLSATALNGNVQITVADTGVGMEPAILQQLFTPFFTDFDPLHHCSGQFEFGRKGLGLGLSIVKAFVEMHGGRVSVASEPGQGSTFTMTLPRQ